MTLNVLSLFSGIGGLELGLERAGMTVVGQVEIDPFCQRVLAKHWPEVPRHDDVRTAVEWWQSEARPGLHAVAGGFPCQDISDAHTNGERRSLAGERSGLWTSYRHIINQLRPRWVIVENVAAWRRWVPDVRAHLARLGYTSLPLEVPAGSLGAPHRRPRIFVVANSDGDGESLSAIHAQASRVRPPTELGGHWRSAFGGPLRMVDGVPSGVDRLRAAGNAVVPQVAEYIGRLVVAADSGVAA